MINFEFDSEKALEALVYVVHRTHGHDMYKVLKTLYVADKLHLANYGRLIYGETYSALEYGPVPSAIYDAVKVVAGQCSPATCRIPESELCSAIERNGTRLFARRDAELDLLSKSDTECLDAAIRDLAYDSFAETMSKTHDSAYLATPRNCTISINSLLDDLPEDKRVAVREYLSAE